MSGVLYLIPNMLGEGSADRSFPPYNYSIIKKLGHFIVETPKNARQLLKKAGVPTPFDNIEFYELNEHTRDREALEMIKPLLAGHDMGLMSDAGYPVIADPGELVVSMAQQNNVKVVPLVGPSSMLMALAASGLNAEQFIFHGYLPVKSVFRQQKLRELDEDARRSGYTQIFMDTPYRNNAVLDDIMNTCHPLSYLCIASNISLQSEKIKTKTVEFWKKRKPDINKIPVIFLLGRAV